MALKGTLKDFSVVDIFQLIGQQGKAGSLFVGNDQHEAHIVFDGGRVVLGTFKKGNEGFLLGTMLLRAGVITAEQLTKAIEVQKTTLRSLGDILKTQGVITSGVLAEFIELQLKEVLFRVFQWKDGFYEFVPEKIQYNRSIIKPQAAEGVLMDGVRMMDEWPAIEGKVGSLESVYRGTSEAPDFPEDDPVVAKVYALLDGKRSAQDIIYVSRLGTFEALRAIAALIDLGVIEKLSELSPTRVLDPYTSQASLSLANWMALSAKALVSVFALFFLIPISAFGIRSYFSSRYSELQGGGTLTGPLKIQSLSQAIENDRIIHALHLYRLETGGFPNLLEELGEKGIEQRWEYQKTPTGYNLSRRPSNE